MINICSRNVKLLGAHKKCLIMKEKCKINILPFYFNSKRKWKVSIGRKKEEHEKTKKSKRKAEELDRGVFLFWGIASSFKLQLN